MIKPTRNSEFTIHVKQLSNGGIDVHIKGFRTSTCLIALMTVTIQELMNGWGLQLRGGYEDYRASHRPRRAHATDSVTRDA
jgi:hypothetical protein